MCDDLCFILIYTYFYCIMEVRYRWASSSSGFHPKVWNGDASGNQSYPRWINGCIGIMNFVRTIVQIQPLESRDKQSSLTRSTCQWCLANTLCSLLIPKGLQQLCDSSQDSSLNLSTCSLVFPTSSLTVLQPWFWYIILWLYTSH